MKTVNHNKELNELEMLQAKYNFYSDIGDEVKAAKISKEIVKFLNKSERPNNGGPGAKQTELKTLF